MSFGDERLLLALLNSAPTEAGHQDDDLRDERRARSWLEDHGVDGQSDIAMLRQARADLWAVTRGQADAAVLDRYLSEVSAVPEVGENGLSWELVVPAARRPVAVSVLAWCELEAGTPGRVRACENPDCTLFLIDRSKSNSARWCSMAVCGNRMKARRHHERGRSRADGSKPAPKNQTLR
jgi:predicted RNA-binding Zn ribbon-like protein